MLNYYCRLCIFIVLGTQFKWINSMLSLWLTGDNSKHKWKYIISYVACDDTYGMSWLWGLSCRISCTDRLLPLAVKSRRLRHQPSDWLHVVMHILTCRPTRIQAIRIDIAIWISVSFRRGILYTLYCAFHPSIHICTVNNWYSECWIGFIYPVTC